MPSANLVHDPASYGCLHCSVLRNACLTVLSPQPTCSRDCPATNRSWRIDVYGPNAVADVAQATTHRSAILDPLISFKRRHLEQDIFTVPTTARPPAAVGSSLHMIWPKHEQGWGDTVMFTLLPLA